MLLDQDSFLAWFAHDIVGQIWTDRESKSSTEDGSAGALTRTILQDNIVVVGPMLTQKRFADGVCHATNFFDVSVCVNEEETTQPFGHDNRFISSSSEFNETLFSQLNPRNKDSRREQWEAYLSKIRALSAMS